MGILEFLGFLGVSGYFYLREFSLGILDYGILEFLRNSNSRCPLGFAVAAVKTRFQGREVIFWNLGAGLAVGHRSGSVQASFAPIFQASR